MQKLLNILIKNQTAVCNLASIALPKFVDKKNKEYDYKKLYETAKLATKNLDQVIDINFYPTIKQIPQIIFIDQLVRYTRSFRCFF